MSASQDKKRRVEERGQGTERRMLAAEKEAAERKKSRIKWTVGTIIVVLLIAVIIVGNSSLFYTQQTAATVGDVKYSVADVNYYYGQAYSNLAQYYYQNFGIQINQILDTSKPLSEQEYTGSDEYDTWDDYFRAAALQLLVQDTALCKAAEDAGMTLSEEDQHSIDEAMAQYAVQAESYGYSSVNKYFLAVYGNGVTKTVVRNLMEREALADKYAASQRDSFTYTDEQLAEEYAEHANEYDTFDYMYYLVQAEKVESEGEDGESTTAPTDETMAAAKATADEIAAAVHDADSFKDAVAEYGVGTAVKDSEGNETDEITPAEPSAAENSAGGNFSSTPFADWLYSADRVANDVTVAEAEGSGYYVVLFQNRSTNDYNTVSVRHILVKTVDADEDNTYSDEEKAAAKKRIDAVLEEWQEGDQTEERFAELAEIKSEDTGSNTNGGLYENIAQGQMVEEFNDFCFDPSRKPGDVGIVYGESSSYSGYHLIYFVGQGPVYRDYIADSLLRNEDYDEWLEEFLTDWSATECRAIKYVR